MSLNSQVEKVLAMFAQAPASDLATLTVEAFRAVSDVPMQIGPPPEVARVEQLSITLEGRTLPARLYLSEVAAAKPPLTLYYHGGGWVIGTLDMHDSTCRALARSKPEPRSMLPWCRAWSTASSACPTPAYGSITRVKSCTRHLAEQ